MKVDWDFKKDIEGEEINNKHFIFKFEGVKITWQKNSFENFK